MDRIPIDCVSSIAFFLPILDQLHLIQTCHRFYDSLGLSHIIKTIASYHPQNTTAFVAACRAGEGRFIEIHLTQGYATPEMALVYSAQYGHLDLFCKYLPRVDLALDQLTRRTITELSLVEIITSICLRHGRGDIFRAMCSVLPQDYQGDDSLLLEQILPLSGNRSIVEALPYIFTKEAMLETVRECTMNPYTAIYFDPALEEEVMKMTDRRHFCGPIEGPIIIDDELAFAYLSRDYRRVEELAEKITTEGIELHHHAKIITAAATTMDGRWLAHALQIVDVDWDDAIRCLFHLDETMIPVVIDVLSKFIDTKDYHGTDRTMTIEERDDEEYVDQAAMDELFGTMADVGEGEDDDDGDEDEEANTEEMDDVVEIDDEDPIQWSTYKDSNPFEDDTFIIHQSGFLDIIRLIDEMWLGDIIIQLAHKYEHDQELLGYLMTIAFEMMIVEAIDVLRDMYHIPLPLDVKDYKVHDRIRYIHPRMVGLMIESGMIPQQIKSVFKKLKRMYLWDLYYRQHITP